MATAVLIKLFGGEEIIHETLLLVVGAAPIVFAGFGFCAEPEKI
jgi:hypothetical protein